MLDDGALAWDVDTPDDLVLPSGEPVADRMAALTLAAATPPAGPVPPLP